MIPSKHKITGKDINYMLRKGRRVHGKVFSFLTIDQYRNNAYTQWGVHISIKISKKATVRNEIKRLVYAAVRELQLPHGHKRIFVSINKKSHPDILSTLARLDKNDILEYRKKSIASDLSYYISSGARRPHSSTNSRKPGRQHGKR